LIGVAVATIPGAQIGRVIPAQDVAALLDGRVVRTTITVKEIRGDLAKLAVEAPLIDPLRRLRRITFHFARSDRVGSVVKPDRDGSWPALPGAQALALQIELQKAVGTLEVPAGDPAARRLLVQTSYVNSQGRTIFTAPVPYLINPTAFTRGQDRAAPSPDGKTAPPAESARATMAMTNSPGPPQPAPKDARSKPPQARTRTGGQPQAAKPSPRRQTENFIEVDVQKGPLRQVPDPFLVWAADGRSFYCSEAGTIYRFNLEDLRQLARWGPENISAPVRWLSPSAEGLLMLGPTRPVEIWVLDPETFAIRKKITARDVSHLASAPALSVAYGLRGEASNVEQSLLVFDLKKGTLARGFDLKRGALARELNAKSLGFPAGYVMPTVSPDGKSLYMRAVYDAGTGSRLVRFQINETRLRLMGASPPFRRSLRTIAISPDSKLVALPIGRDTEQRTLPGLPARKETEIPVFRVSNLARPALTLRTRPECSEFLHFSSGSGGFIASGGGLIFFDRNGNRKNWVPAGSSGDQEILHPDGHTMLAAGRNGLYKITFPNVDADRLPAGGVGPGGARADGERGRKP
jgi:hypothetical protein